VSNRIVLAYSGTPAATAAIRALGEQRRAEIVTLTLDLGTRDDLQEVHERAMAAGAVRAHVLDVREEFLRDYVLPSLQRATPRGAADPMPASLAHPLIAKKLDDIAAIERASAVVHEPEADVETKPVSAKMRGDAGSEADVAITFEDGVPVAISGIPMPLTELFESLAIIAAQHGIQPVSRFRDAPAAVVLAAAYAALSQSDRASAPAPAGGTVRLRIARGALHVDRHVALPGVVGS
jgi:argininosuccinate synthase